MYKQYGQQIKYQYLLEWLSTSELLFKSPPVQSPATYQSFSDPKLIISPHLRFPMDYFFICIIITSKVHIIFS